MLLATRSMLPLTSYGLIICEFADISETVLIEWCHFQ